MNAAVSKGKQFLVVKELKIATLFYSASSFQPFCGNPSFFIPAEISAVSFSMLLKISPKKIALCQKFLGITQYRSRGDKIGSRGRHSQENKNTPKT